MSGNRNVIRRRTSTLDEIAVLPLDFSSPCLTQRSIFTKGSSNCLLTPPRRSLRVYGDLSVSMTRRLVGGSSMPRPTPARGSRCA